MADDAEQVSTVEWGATPPERQTWMDRLTAGAAPAPLEPPVPRFRPSYLALGLALVGVVLEAGSQYTPWIHLTNAPSNATDGGVGNANLHLASLPSVSTLVYGFSLIIGLTMVGMLLFTETHRRLVAGATAGALAGNMLALINVATSIELVTGQFGNGDGTQTGSLSSGFYLGLAAWALLVAATVAVVVPRRSRRTPGKEALEESMELTVTGLGSDIG